MKFSERLFGTFFNPDEPPPGNPPADPAPPADPVPKTYDEAYVKQLRDEAAANRRKAADAEKRLKELDDANLSEADKLKQRAEAAEKKVTDGQARIAKAEVKAAAASAKIIDPEAAYKLVRDDITFDKDGEPENVEALISDLVKNKPWLLGSGDGGGGNPTNPQKGRPMTKEAAAELARTDPKEFNRRVNAGEIKLADVFK
jgi:hypothetical protein